jgi:hypothetical protein
MLANADFWKEFDARLDARLAPITKKLDALVKWTQRQDKSIEHELNEAMTAHLQETYRGFLTMMPSAFPKKINNQNGLEITEFDGIVIMTNFPDYKAVVCPERGVASAHAPASLGQGYKIYLVIVEAKQHVTANKVARKIKQKQELEHLLDEVRSGKTNNDVVRHFGMQLFEPVVGLYIGGLEIDPVGKTSIQNLAIDNPMCGWIDVNGTRFSVKDVTNDYGVTKFGGARQKKRS